MNQIRVYNTGTPVGQHPVVVQIKDSMTIAVIKMDNIVGVGVARCNPIDKFNEKIGVHIAIARAVGAIVDDYEQLWIERARSRDEVLEQRAARKQRKG